MTIFVQDTARNNLVSWSVKSVRSGWCQGVIISPFASPVDGTRYKQSASKTVERLDKTSCVTWFDPMTHALQMPNVADFRYYDEWDLWSGARGDLSSDQACRNHVERVFKIQDSFGAPRLAPTILLNSPQSPASSLALKISKIALDLDSTCWLSVVGDVHFWSSASDLDAHVGALAQLSTPGWMATVVRSRPDLPVHATAAEVFGLLRSVRGLSEYSRVCVEFGDVAALPAVSAGAESVGTGWDTRQRVCAYSDYQARIQGGDGGQWYSRPTLRGLLGSLTTNEYEVLKSGDSALATRLAPGVIAPGPESAFSHHVSVLHAIVQELSALSPKAAYDRLLKMYVDATSDWPLVSQIFPTSTNARQWIEPFHAGLVLYGREEGW